MSISGNTLQQPSHQTADKADLGLSLIVKISGVGYNAKQKKEQMKKGRRGREGEQGKDGYEGRHP